VRHIQTFEGQISGLPLRFRIAVENCPQQTDSSSCGIFALAWWWLCVDSRFPPADHPIIPSL
jgi:hypothetical protein